MPLSVSIAFAFIAILFIQTADSSGSVHAIRQQQTSSIAAPTNSALLDEKASTLNTVFKLRNL